MKCAKFFVDARWALVLIEALVSTATSRAGTFTNATPITIPATDTGANSGAPAAPYPSVISISGFPGNEVISNLTVTLRNFSHAFPDDVDILLIGPNGVRVLLMSDAGAFNGVTGIDVTFDDAANPLPDATIITSGTYRPTNYGTPDAFQPPVPAGPHGSSLGAFNDLQPNGDWSLYVIDDAEFDVGSIAGGWTIHFTTFATTCGNNATEPGEDCDDGNTVPGDGCGPTCLIEVCGNGYVDPVEGCDDGNTISGDGCNSTCGVEFCGDGIIQKGIGESCEDDNTVGGDGCSAICGTEVCGNAVVDPGEDCDDGNAVDCDGCNACTDVGPPYCNLDTITIPAPPSTGDGGGAPSDPYPSIISVSGTPAGHVVSSLTVTLKGLTHTNPDDIDLLLVGPDGIKVFLMSDAGGATNVSNIDVTIADGAGQLPDNAVINTGTYAPTNHGTPDFFPATAPPGPYASTLSAFIGSKPFGPWSLFMVDDEANFEIGGLAEWYLNMITAYAECGNGVVEPGEQCDDGNLTGGDGCSAICDTEVCGNGIVDPGESCDDGNMVPCDGCDEECLIEEPAVCGNAVPECGEECDDGNSNATDGCLEDCTQGPAVPPVPPGCPAATINSYFSTDTPQSISAAGTPTVTSTISVNGEVLGDQTHLLAGSILFDVNVKVFITHTDNGNLDVTVTSPSGTSVTLTSDNANGFRNVFDGTIWDDQADAVLRYAGGFSGFRLTTDTTYENGVTTEFLAPEEALAAFNGEDPNGVWTLKISDDTDFGGGDLNRWELWLATFPQPPSVVNTATANSAPGLPIGPGLSTVKDSVSVSGVTGTIGKVAVFTEIAHTQNADLDLYLISPKGTVVTLTTDNGGPNDNVFLGVNWRFDVDPGNPAPYPHPNPSSNLVTDTAYVNLFPKAALVPEEPLSAFNGENPNGTWTLRVGDDANPNGGTLNSWSLTITTDSCELPELCELVRGTADDPCFGRQVMDCAGSASDSFCRPTHVMLDPSATNQVVASKCYCEIKESDTCAAVGIGESEIGCNGPCIPGGCRIYEDGHPLGVNALAINFMIEGAMYTCDCVGILDIDGDDDADAKDFQFFMNCFGQAVSPGHPCESADRNVDGVVNHEDLPLFTSTMSGPGP